MAKRIAIVLSQLNGATPAQRELEGAIVAELLMVQGHEVTLVTDLTTLGDDDTGMLCLEGITGDMVMLSWMPHGEAHRHLRERGVHGRLGRTMLGSDVDTAGEPRDGNGFSRTIYHVDLRSVQDVKECCTEIERIRNEASVQVIGLGLVSPMDSKPTNRPDAAAVSEKSTSVPRSNSPAPPQQERSKVDTSLDSDADDDDPGLDELMDQFDAWDV